MSTPLYLTFEEHQALLIRLGKQDKCDVTLLDGVITRLDGRKVVLLPETRTGSAQDKANQT